MKTLLAPWCWICLVSIGLPGRIAAAECTTPPLDEEILPHLSIWLPTSAPAGRELAFYFGYVECCYVMLHATDCVGFSVTPAGSAEIELPLPAPQEPRAEAKYGKLKLGSLLNHGDTVTLRADVEDGRRVLEATVHIYTSEANPLVGRWREVSQFQCAGFTRGDSDQDSRLVITDAVVILNALFLGDSVPDCLDAADANADGGIDIADPIHILSYLFGNGDPPAPPFPGCGPVLGQVLGCAAPACGGKEETPARPIQELIFEADGTFSLTWTPFELYKDYWGTYEYDLASRSLALEVKGGNYIPPLIFSNSPRFRIAPDGSLVLENIWLGASRNGPATLRCGHRFQ